MLVLKEYIVLLWGLPAIFFVILLLSSLFYWITRLCAKILLGSHGSSAPTLLNDLSPLQEDLRQRKEPRIDVPEIVQVQLADGAIFTQGAITNISTHGLCITGLSTAALASCSELSVTVTDTAEQFTLECQPSWSQKNGEFYTIGLHVTQPSEAWFSYVSTPHKEGSKVLKR